MVRFLILFFIAILFSGQSLLATDSTMLDSLVKNGILTPEEASYVKRESVANIEILRPTTKKIRLSSRFQLQGEWIDASFEDVSHKNTGFIVRRMFLQADADVGNQWKARFSVDLARNQTNNILSDNYIARNFDGEYINGELTIGYMKPGILVEEVTSSFSLNAIERSAATTYWSSAANGRRLGIGNRYAGVMWKGNIPQIKGMSYNMAISNSFQHSTYSIDALEYNYKRNNLAYWLGVHYQLKGDDYNVKFGIYSMYSSSANQNMGLAKEAAVYTINPYYTGNWGNWFFWGEFIASGVSDGKKVNGNYTQANPYGFNFSLEYRFDIGEYGKIAPTFRYSWLDTGGRGVKISDVQRQSDNIGYLYNDAQNFYVGLNWYLRGDDLKIQLGCDYVQYSSSINNANVSGFAESMAVRLQFQIKL